jgi:hypothetical protein
MSAVAIRYRRVQKGQFAQKLQHALPSVIVLSDGLDHLQHDPHGASLALGIAEVGISLAVIVTVVRGFRRLIRPADSTHDGHTHHGIDWIDLSLGGMLLVEANAKYHANGRLARPTIGLGVALILLGLVHGRIVAWGNRRRELRVDEEGISIPGRFFRRLSLPWAEVAEITAGPSRVRVIATDGREQDIDLADAVNADAIRHVLNEARERLEAHRVAFTGQSNITTE